MSDKKLIEQIGDLSLLVGHAQDVMNSSENISMIMSKGEKSKTDANMKYVSQITFTKSISEQHLII